MLYGLDHNLQEPHFSAHVAEAREHQSDFVFGKSPTGRALPFGNAQLLTRNFPKTEKFLVPAEELSWL